MSNSRRGRVLIEPYKQLRFGITFLVMNLFFSFLIIGVFTYFMYDVYDAIAVYFRLDPNQSLLTFSKFMQPVLIVGVLLVIFIASTLGISAYYTHQIYGPLVAIRRFLDELLSKNSAMPIKLRASDHLKEIAEKLNGLVQKFTLVDKERSVDTMNSFLEELLRGNIPGHIHLEKGDPLMEIAEKLNRLVDEKFSKHKK